MSFFVVLPFALHDIQPKLSQGTLDIALVCENKTQIIDLSLKIVELVKLQ